MQALHDIVESVRAIGFLHLCASSIHELLAANLVKVRIKALSVLQRACVVAPFAYQDVAQLMVIEADDFYMGGQHNDMPACLRQVIATGRSNFARESRDRQGTSCFAYCLHVLAFLRGSVLTRQVPHYSKSSAAARRLRRRCWTGRTTTFPKGLARERHCKSCTTPTSMPSRNPSGWKRLGSTPS